MIVQQSIDRRPQIVGVIASRADLERGIRMRKPPDLFELRLDCLGDIAGEVKNLLPKLPAPLMITARHPDEGGANNLGIRQRRDLLTRFLDQAEYVDVELRSAAALRPFLKLAKHRKIRRIISFHNFRSTPTERMLAAKARDAESHGADIFKVATRTDTPTELGRLVNFMTQNRLNLGVAAMGIGKLGAISRVLLARAGSALIYASVCPASAIEGQLSLQQLGALGFRV